MNPVPNNDVHAIGVARDAIYPQVFSGARGAGSAREYRSDPAIQKLLEFFDGKGLASIRNEERREAWYEDWVSFQADHRLYAQLISPREFSTLGFRFDLIRLARFLEVFAYCSPAHGYSLQVTFLGLFSILMGTNSALKREAVAALEAGGLHAFGVSEKAHGSDLLGNEFTVRETDAGRLVANGTKYYIGNANVASIISILARREDDRGQAFARRAPLILFALRPGKSAGMRTVSKIGTHGVRSAFVGEFEVRSHELPASDVIAEGRAAWDAVFGTVTLGKFFLGFGSIGICEHAFEEAAGHLWGRVLYGRRATEMPHLRWTMAQAYARLTAMKLFAYRALDYVHSGSATDRRYLLFCAVQKARVSTEGVKVMALLSECIGARGFESGTYFEMALRDAALIPSLESSAHINLGLTAQFIRRYFSGADPSLGEPPSVLAGETSSQENAYLMEARTGAIGTIAFPSFLNAYRPLASVANVRLFARASKAFELLVRSRPAGEGERADTPATLARGQCLAMIAYAQLIAENAVRLRVSTALVALIFHALVCDFNAAVLTLGSCAGSDAMRSDRFRRLVSVPRISDAEFELVAEQMLAARGDDRCGRIE
jgi:acyl-CoA dehydrogenase